jgi:putative ATP-binding cassette transporter
MTLQRRWRAQVTAELYDNWLADDRYRKLRFIPGEHQTPEFRIAEDARVATDLPIDLVLGLLTSIITAITFIGVLSSVGGDLYLGAWGMGLTIPAYLVIAVVLYSVLVMVAMLVLARDLTHVWEENKRTEAELRSTGSHLREKGEGTAMPDGREDGRAVMRRALAQVLQRWVDLCHQLMRTTLVSHSSTLLSPVVGLLLCTPQYLDGVMTLGQVVQAAAAFAVVHSAFSWVTDNYARLAEWTASAHRVGSLLIALDEVDGVDRSGNHVAAADLASAPRQPPGD